MNNNQITNEILANDINEILEIVKNGGGNYSVSFYIIKNTRSKAKDKKRWYNVYLSNYDEEAKKEFLDETIKQLENVYSKVKSGYSVVDFLKPEEKNNNGKELT